MTLPRRKLGPGVISCVIFVLLAISAFCACAPLGRVAPDTLASLPVPQELTAREEPQLPPETSLEQSLRLPRARAGPRLDNRERRFALSIPHLQALAVNTPRIVPPGSSDRLVSSRMVGTPSRFRESQSWKGDVSPRATYACECADDPAAKT